MQAEPDVGPAHRIRSGQRVGGRRLGSVVVAGCTGNPTSGISVRIRGEYRALLVLPGEYAVDLAGLHAKEGVVMHFRLSCPWFWVDARLLVVGRRWIASADTAEGPSLGCADNPAEALWQALQPLDGVIDELLASQGW